MVNKNLHTFHIPVMGTGYTIDSPLKVARFGINSVVSIIDHRLMELIRADYAAKFGKVFKKIDENAEDSRALRITAYLDFLQEVVNAQFEKIQAEPFESTSEITKYFELLPERSSLKSEYLQMLQHKGEERWRREEELRGKMKPGSIDVNVMTKIDKQNFTKGKQPLPQQYNDAHAAVRGFARSRLQSSMILSAGLNPRLYGYIAGFSDFLPDSEGEFRKKLILKVSDYRSALVQGKFLAKKGLWVSEFRVESGLNCGGHAFATEGQLIGPILNEFKEKREELSNTLFELYKQARSSIDLLIPEKSPEILYSVQGGVGTAEEHEFLQEEYEVHSVGWGSPFLLVPEAINIDKNTLELLCKAGENELYLSDISPLGVPFNTVRGTSAEKEREARILAGKPGSPCYKEHLISNVEFTQDPICTASRQYQRKKISMLRNSINEKKELDRAIDEVVQKTCLCVGLGNSAMMSANATPYKGMQGVVICPGPNLAYFSQVVSLSEMVDHIYGRRNIIKSPDRPHMFLKEMKIYFEYFLNKVKGLKEEADKQQRSYLQSFKDNLSCCMDYYVQLIIDSPKHFPLEGGKIVTEIGILKTKLQALYCGPAIMH